MKCLSLFSGCGGLDLGLENAGFDIVFSNDNSERCYESYIKNFKNHTFYLGSISDLTKELMSDLSGGATDSGIDLVAGGPPCQPFSKSRFYRKEKPRGMEDPMGLEAIKGYVNVLKIVKPRAFILENVHGFAYKVHKHAFDYVTEEAKKLGYNYTWKVINAADYGVPQIRKRFFLVGTLDGEFVFPEPTHQEPSENVSASGLPYWTTVGDVINDLDTEENACDKGHFAGGKHHELLKQVPPGDNYLYFTEKRGHPDPKFEWRSRYWSFLLKLSPDLPSWTIQARRSNNMGPLHWRNRILRIEEVKRLQTFPDDWYLSGKVDEQWRQVGNAVPPMLGHVLGTALYNHLEQAGGYSDTECRKVAIG